MSIEWGEHFLTGISDIDGQHRTLVSLVNELEAAIAARRGHELIDEAFHSLAAYARVHFTLEEKLMDEAGVDPLHVSLHRRAHANFGDDLLLMWRPESATEDELPRRLLNFVTTWVHQHILGTDREMARNYFLETGQPMPAPLQAA